MPGFLKHIFTFLFAILLAHVFVASFHSEDMVFDPMDNDDSATIVQTTNNNGIPSYCDLSNSHRSIPGFFTEQKNGKKGKEAKFIVFKFISSGVAKGATELPDPKMVHNAARQQGYNYLFYEEINPPPPKYC